MKYIIISLLIGAAATFGLAPPPHPTKCEYCFDFFDLLAELNGKNLTDQYQFAKDIDFACKILSRDDNHKELAAVCKFARENVPSIYNYVRYVDHGIHPEKDCWLFFRCRKAPPPPPTEAPEPVSGAPFDFQQHLDMMRIMNENLPQL